MAAISASGPGGGEPQGLCFEDTSDGVQVVSPETLRAHVDCVAGMTGSIHDDAARSFAIAPGIRLQGVPVLKVALTARSTARR